MNEQIKNILELPAPHKVGILVLSILLIGVVFWFLFLSPVIDEFSTLKEEVDGDTGLRVKIAQKQGIADNLDRFVKEVAHLEVELQRALTQLPDKKEIDELLAKVSALGRNAGLEMRLFRPRPETKKDYYAEVPVEMKVTGSYHQLGTFFDEVGHLNRVVNLDKFDFTKPEISSEIVKLHASVVATTFRFLDESERPTKKGKKKRKRRRGKKK